MTSNFNEAFAGYITQVTAAVAENDARFTMLDPTVVDFEMGSVYVRVLTGRPGQGRSVHSFVRIADGAVMKPAGWKAPFISKAGKDFIKRQKALGVKSPLPTDPATARANIFDADFGKSAVGCYGTTTIR